MKTPRGNSTKRNFSLEMKELENFQLYTNCINEFYCNLIEWNFVALSLRKKYRCFIVNSQLCSQILLLFKNVL